MICECPMCSFCFDVIDEAYCRCGYFYRIKSRENYRVEEAQLEKELALLVEQSRKCLSGFALEMENAMRE